MPQRVRSTEYGEQNGAVFRNQQVSSHLRFGRHLLRKLLTLVLPLAVVLRNVERLGQLVGLLLLHLTFSTNVALSGRRNYKWWPQGSRFKIPFSSSGLHQKRHGTTIMICSVGNTSDHTGLGDGIYRP